MTIQINDLTNTLDQTAKFNQHQEELKRISEERRLHYIRSYKQLIKRVKDTLDNNELDETVKLSTIEYAVNLAIQENQFRDDTYNNLVNLLAKLYS